ncbi:prolyl oligopeptidase family serine peptidase [Paenibacillus sp. alder61]|uniref:Prolyl oligopeptidase family serine peptidase n=1 Tax=Paenibacillus faecis TaxID=862114 RepID=A0A5D0CU95_9BACL|nr:MULTISPECIES: prolyl oligopeptidase family serine peptidase [Paenibacillus]MCA1293654.1 prolyl oligopeptidase family serine peptidase [Paenibacillus sp. alder61]TYA12764.1 prolyl oligopeptidase family serine peptidase [Paenibacillus faecis]
MILVIIIWIAATLSSCKATDPPESDIEIISKELIEVPGQNPNIDIYKLFYKSDNIKVLTYMTVPKDVNLRWLDEHPDVNSPEIVAENRETAGYVRYGLINVNPESKGDYSILDRVPDIQAPVLLLQGTADESLIWQTVQDFADEMEEAGKTVKLVLYPDGRHGLADKYQDQRNQEVMQWLHKYGVPQSFVMQ